MQYIGEDNESGIISVRTNDLLPDVGDPSLIYRVIEDKLLYQWNSDVNKYELLNAIDDIQVNVNDIIQTNGDYIILYGGSAVDNI